MAIPHPAASLRTDHLVRNGDVVTPRLWPHLPNITLALLRVVTGLLFMEHGIQKFFGILVPPGQPAMPAPGVFTQLWFAGTLEMVGGALIVLGLFTRVVAFLLSGEMAFAYFLVHAKRNFFPIVNLGELAVLYCFVFLMFAAIGGGRFSLDHLFVHRGASHSHEGEVEETAGVLH